MGVSDIRLNLEFRLGIEYMVHHLTPSPGAMPKIPGIDIFSQSIPFNGIAGGDLITYVNFQERFDLDSRIHNATAQEKMDTARALQMLGRTGGILIADVAGHEFVDSVKALLLHQAFRTAALYEMDLRGEITVGLFEQINTRFLKSTPLRNLVAERHESSFITLLYGEISHTGRFHFVNAGHPPPLVFSNAYNRFVEISNDRLVSYTPIGLQPVEDLADAKNYERILGYKKRYTLNELNLMGRGDVLLLYTDGLLDSFSDYTQELLERTISDFRCHSAKEICEAIVRERSRVTSQTDDLSLVVIKYC